MVLIINAASNKYDDTVGNSIIAGTNIITDQDIE
jgi:hypothetical protein